jgi:hypothetical protein
LAKRFVPQADIGVIMIAPKSPGHLMRRQFQEGKGVPALLAIHQGTSGKASERALACAKRIGSTPRNDAVDSQGDRIILFMWGRLSSLLSSACSTSVFAEFTGLNRY